MVTLRNWYLLVSKPWSVLRYCKDLHVFLTDPRIPVCAKGKATGSHLDMHWTWNSASTDPESAKKNERCELWADSSWVGCDMLIFWGWILGWQMWRLDEHLRLKVQEGLKFGLRRGFMLGKMMLWLGLKKDWTLVEWRVKKRPKPRQKKLVRAYWYTGYIYK